MTKNSATKKSRDRHLNLFYNYNNEHLRSFSKSEDSEMATRVILEDNLTRAFLIFLDFLSENKSFNDFIGILPSKNQSEKAITLLRKLKEPDFDLQNLDYVKNKEFVRQKETKKLLLILSTKPFDPKGIFDQNKPNKTKTETINVDGQPKGSIKESDNRADGWILEKTNKTAVLVEVKIGNNPVDVNQLRRHIRGSQGFNLRSFGDEDFDDREFNIDNVISLTWRQISESLNTFKKKLSDDCMAYHNYFIDNLQRYIYMSTADINLLNLMDKEIEFSEKKEIFSFILKKLDEKVKDESKNDTNLLLYRKPRPLDGLWDIWGKKNEKNNDVLKTPHISMGLWDRNLGISLDLPVTSKKDFERLKKQFEEGKLGEFIQLILNTEKYKNSLSRFKINISEARIWDWKKGQMRGDKNTKFSLSFDFDILKSEKKDFDEFIQRVIGLARNRKRFFLSFTLRLPSDSEDIGEVNESRNDAFLDQQVRDWLKDENRLIEEFWSIFKHFIYIHNDYRQ